MARWPSLPSISGLAKDIQQAIAPLKEILAKMTGQSGNWEDQVVTKGDMVNGGLATYRSADGTRHQARNAAGNLIPVQEGSAYFQTPPAVTGLTATGAFGTIFLQWTVPSFPYIAFYNIYRADVDNVGVAVRIGTTSDSFYPDVLGDGTGAVPKYYWVSVASEANKEGPKNAIAGTVGRTAYSQDYLLSILTKKWQANYTYAAGGYVIPNPANETGVWFHTVAGGTSGSTEPTWPSVVGNTVVDGTITWQAIAKPTQLPPFLVGEVGGVPGVIINNVWIGDATITSAMIESLTANKITAGTITAAVELLAATITSGYIRTSAGTGQRLEIDDTGFFIWAGSGAKSAANAVFSINDAGGMEIRDTSGNLLLSTAGTGLTTEVKNYRIASNGFFSVTHNISAGLYDSSNTLINGASISYNVDVIDRASGTITSTNYDVYINSSNASLLASHLNGLGSDKIVIIRTYDEPQLNRTAGGLPSAIYRCGGSKAIFESTNFKFRSAYVLVGIPGCGEGNGIEFYKGDVDNDTNAWVDTTITIRNGNLVGGRANSQTYKDIEAVVSVNDAGAIRNASWPTNKKMSLDYANQQIAIGDDNWSGTNPMIIHQYNGGTPRSFIGNRNTNHYVEFDGSTLNIKGDMNGGNINGATIVSDSIKDSTYGLYSAHVLTKKIDLSSFSDVEAPVHVGYVTSPLQGMLTATVNYTLYTYPYVLYKQLPGFNVANGKPYWHIRVNPGQILSPLQDGVDIYLYRSNIVADIAGIQYLYVTIMFNSNETAGGWDGINL